MRDGKVFTRGCAGQNETRDAFELDRQRNLIFFKGRKPERMCAAKGGLPPAITKTLWRNTNLAIMKNTRVTTRPFRGGSKG